MKLVTVVEHEIEKYTVAMRRSNALVTLAARQTRGGEKCGVKKNGVPWLSHPSQNNRTEKTLVHSNHPLPTNMTATR